MKILKFALLCLCVLHTVAPARGDVNVERSPLIVVISSPSGGGKTSIAQKLFELDPHLTPAISVTTRPPRSGEIEGQDYHFIDLKQFQTLEKQQAFLQTAAVFGNHYGTLRKDIDQSLAHGKDVLFTVDWQASRSLTKAYPNNIVRIFILPPSLSALQQRLTARGQDAADVIQRRMAQALSEIKHWAEYDYVIINDGFDQSVSQVHAILQSERLKRVRQVGLQKFVNELSSQE